nr:hypothetical protein [Methylorubrum extorquens]
MQPLVGRSIEKLSLQTKDPELVRPRFVHAMHEIEARWARLTAGPAVLSGREAHELAATAHDRWITEHRDNLSQSPWRTDLFARVWQKRRLGLWRRPDVVYQVRSGEDEMEAWCLKQTDNLTAKKGLQTNDDGCGILAKAFSPAIQRASLKLGRGHIKLAAPRVWLRIL